MSAAAGDEVGPPVLVQEANNINDGATDTLTFSLTGQGNEDFAVNNVDGRAQIVVVDLLVFQVLHEEVVIGLRHLLN